MTSVADFRVLALDASGGAELDRNNLHIATFDKEPTYVTHQRSDRSHLQRSASGL